MVRFAAAAACLLLSAGAHAGCSTTLAQQIAASQHALDTLHPDKPGQLRVVAADGSEFSAGQVRWMAGQLHRVTAACQQSDELAATAALAGVAGLLDTHRPAA